MLTSFFLSFLFFYFSFHVSVELFSTFSFSNKLLQETLQILLKIMRPHWLSLYICAYHHTHTHTLYLVRLVVWSTELHNSSIKRVYHTPYTRGLS